MDKANINCLKNGGVGIMATDTIYGLVGSAFSPEAVERIYQLKKRAPKKPLIVLIADWADLEKFEAIISDTDRKILENKSKLRPTSFILPIKGNNLEYLHRGTNTIAFRLPNDERLRKVLRETGPLVAPSANPESAPVATTIAEAKKYFGEEVGPAKKSGINFYEDGGLRAGAPSTLIKLRNGKIEILRRERICPIGYPSAAKKNTSRRALLCREQ